MAQNSKCGPWLVLCFFIAVIAGSAWPARVHAAPVPPIFSSERFAALLHDNPSVWETARRLVQNPSADFSPEFEKSGCRKLLTEQNLAFQDFYVRLSHLVNGNDAAVDFINEWASRLERASASPRDIKAQQALVIETGSGSGLIVFKEPRFAYVVSNRTLWYGWADEQEQRVFRELEKDAPKQIPLKSSASDDIPMSIPISVRNWSPEFGAQRKLFADDLDKILLLVSLGQTRPRGTVEQALQNFNDWAKQFDSALGHLEAALGSAQSAEERAETMMLSNLLSTYYSVELSPDTLTRSLNGDQKKSVERVVALFNENIGRLHTLQAVIKDWKSQ
jgi:hypothetical protein